MDGHGHECLEALRRVTGAAWMTRALDLLEDGLVIAASCGCLVFANASAGRLFGEHPEDLLGVCWNDRVLPVAVDAVDPPVPIAIDALAHAPGRSYVWLVRNAGIRLMVGVRVTPLTLAGMAMSSLTLREPSGRVLDARSARALGVVSGDDGTPRPSADLVTWAQDLRSGRLHWGPGAGDLLGLDARGTPSLAGFYGLIPPHQQGDLALCMAAALTYGGAYAIRVGPLHLWPGQVARTVEIRGSVTVDDCGRPSAWRVRIRDVVRSAEARLRGRVGFARFSDEAARAQHGLLLLEARAGRAPAVLSVNQVFAEMAGSTICQLIGRSPASLVRQASAEQPAASPCETATGGIKIQDLGELDGELTRDDGSRVPVSMTGQLLLDEHGEPDCYLTHVHERLGASLARWAEVPEIHVARRHHVIGAGRPSGAWSEALPPSRDVMAVCVARVQVPATGDDEADAALRRLTAIRLRSTYRLLVEDNLDSAAVLEHLNEHEWPATAAPPVDVLHLRLDAATGLLEYGCAGSLRLVVLPDLSVPGAHAELLPLVGGPSLGLVPDASYQQGLLALDRGSVVVAVAPSRLDVRGDDVWSGETMRALTDAVRALPPTASESYVQAIADTVVRLATRATSSTDGQRSNESPRWSCALGDSVVVVLGRRPDLPARDREFRSRG